MEINKPLFIEVYSVDEMNDRSKEGYEFVSVVYKEHINIQSNYTSFDGTFMNNPVSMGGNVNSPTTQKSTWYLMKLGTVAQVIYGSD